MDKLVFLQATLVIECFITHITGIWTLVTMDMLVLPQVTRVIECFITHITGIRTLATVYKQVVL